MNFGNPTQITLGMTGEFYGRKYRVVGRVLLGETEDGVIYGWNEFNMVADSGEAATLVFEQTQRGPEWRWFTMFDPEFELPAEDAATKRVGDVVNIDGTDAKVTLVQESRIYSIEGQAPEGQHVGSRANYFNAEEGSKMVVVSWTGREMEYYHGVTISSGMVASAFNLRTGELLKSSLASGGNFMGLQSGTIAFALVAIGIFFLIIFLNGTTGNRPPAVVRYASPPSPLLVGGMGSLNGTIYHLLEHAEVEIDETGRFVNRQEYYLEDDFGHDAVLVLGLKPDWYLFTPVELTLRPGSQGVVLTFNPVQPLSALTPMQAGGATIGQTIMVEGTNVSISEVFRSIVHQVEPADATNVMAGVSYGFLATAKETIFMARWNENGITTYEGRPISAKEVLAAFGKSAAK